MSKEDFRKLLSQWANEDVYIGQLTWEEGDALAERLANWYASQQSFGPDASLVTRDSSGVVTCKVCGTGLGFE